MPQAAPLRLQPPPGIIEASTNPALESETTYASEPANTGNNTETTAPANESSEGIELLASAEVVESGTCGTVNWSLDSDGVLTVSEGTLGSMDDWLGYTNRSSIKSVVFEGEVVAGESIKYLFLRCENLTTIDLSHLDTSNTTDASWAFSGCSGLTTLDLSHFDTSNMTNMYEIFSGCSALTSLDLSDFNTSNVTNMYGMFMNCSGLTSLDLSGFDTSKVTLMSYMFSGCSNLTDINLSSFNTSRVRDMCEMFENCSSLTSIDVSNFDTSEVDKMASMFKGCSSLTSLDVTNFETPYLTHANQMFKGCSSLTSLDLSSFNTAKTNSMFDMFADCTKLSKIEFGEKFKTYSVYPDNIKNIFPTPTVAYSGNSSWGTWGLGSETAQTTYTPDELIKLGKTAGKLTGVWYAQASVLRVYLAEETSYVYTGSAFKPWIQVYYAANGLSEDRDYTVTYSNNINAGTATVTVQGIGSYEGTATCTFEIAKATPKYTVPTGLTGAYGSTLSSVELPQGFTWQDGETKLSKLGETTGHVTYTPEDADNYETIKDIAVTVSVAQASIAGASVTFDDQEIVYNTLAKTPIPTVTLNGQTLKKGTDYTITYSNNVNAGSDATATLKGRSNYTGEVSATFTIHKATPNYKVPSGLTASYADTLAAAEPTEGFSWVDGNIELLTLGKNTYYATYTPRDTSNYVVVNDVPIVVTVNAANIGNAEINMVEQSFVYDGTTHVPQFEITYKGRGLEQDKDYSVEVSPTEGINAGTSTYTIKGLGNYTESTSGSYSISPADISQNEGIAVELNQENLIYNGTAKTPKATVTYNGTILSSGSDYTVSYTDNIAVSSEAKAIITGRRNWTGSITKTFTITPADISGASITLDQSSFMYTGSEKMPVPTVVVDNKTLTVDVDYTVSYADNIAIGSEAKVIVSGKGNWTGSATTTFAITTNDISGATVTLNSYEWTYDGTAKEPVPTVVLNGATLTKDVDYTVAYTNNVEPGKATVAITGQGSCVGSTSEQFRIRNGGDGLSRENAKDLLIGETASGNLKEEDWSSSNRHYYKVTPDKDCLLRISFRHNYDNSYGRYFFWFSTDDEDHYCYGDYDSSWASNASDTKTKRSPAVVGEAGKTYYITVWSSVPCVARYYLTVEQGTCAEFNTHATILPLSYNADSHWSVCSLCGASYDTTEHEWYSYKRTKEPTCGTPGAETYRCAKCAATKTEEIPATGDHNWDDGTITTPPTTSAEGARTYTCTRCGAKRTEAIAKLSRIDWTRLWGSTRYSTMQTISQTGWESASTVILASGANFPDALSASSLAGVYNAPIILTNPSYLSSEARSEIWRLGAKTVYIIGGKAAVSDSVRSEVTSMGCDVKRLSGDVRTGTARAVAAEVQKYAHSNTCIVASGQKFPDALSISPYAYSSKSPIYLAEGNGTLSWDTLSAIKSAGYSRVIIVGGSSAVSISTESALRQLGIANVARLGGATRYESSALIANWAKQQGMSMAYTSVACGFNFPDALSGAALCGKNNSVLVLADDKNSSCITGFVRENRGSISHGYVFGGTSAVSWDVWDKLPE